MNIYTVIGIIIVAILIFLLRKNNSQNSPKNNNLTLREIVKSSFPKYKIIEKHGTVMICEINHRNEPDELVFIRVNANTKKSIKYSGRMMMIDYPYKPNANELKRDINKHLK